MNQRMKWAHYSVMLLAALGIFVGSIFSAFNYMLQTSKTSAVNQAYDYFVLLQAHHGVDRLVHRLQMADFDPQTALSEKGGLLSLREQLANAKGRVKEMTEGETWERLRLMPGLPEFVNHLNDAFKKVEISLNENPSNYQAAYKATEKLSEVFSSFTGSPTGLLIIREKLENTHYSGHFYFSGVLISGIAVLLLYGLTLRRTIVDTKSLTSLNRQLEVERDQLRRAKETLFNQTEALFEQAEALFYQASHDPLTELINRHEFEQRLRTLLQRTLQHNEEHAMCYMDLDQFKVINDTCGHAAGDELLRQLANLMKQHVQSDDSIARMGGDEFAILIKNCLVKEAIELAEVLRQAIQNYRFVWQRHIFEIAVSIGVVRINQQSGTLSEIFSDADAACYIAKENGRNRVHIYESDDQTIQRHKGEMAWVSRIRQSFEEKRFRLYRQLIVPVDPNHHEKMHYEVLIRMLDEEGKLVSPIAFIPAAENYNLMPTLDRWIVQNMFEYLVSNPEALEELAVCSINLSGVSISDKTFSNFLTEQLKNYSIPPEKICFEVTETAAITNLTEASKFIRFFKDQGCRFSLDDFGSGMSSFAYLKNLPVDYLKIDGSFIKDIVNDTINHAMVEAIHRVGHVMGLRTIAEYVENFEILEKLRQIGIDYAQGYAISRPAPFIEEVNQLTTIVKTESV